MQAEAAQIGGGRRQIEGGSASSVSAIIGWAARGDTLTVRLGDDVAQAFEREARETGVSKGEIVRQAIVARLRREDAPSVMARCFGVMRGPADLSANKTVLAFDLAEQAASVLALLEKYARVARVSALRT